MPIIISKNGKGARRVEKTSFKQEEDLLKYIYENPNCILIEDIKEDVQFVIGGNLGLQKKKTCPLKIAMIVIF